jgi:hypothetical protein
MLTEVASNTFAAEEDKVYTRGAAKSPVSVVARQVVGVCLFAKGINTGTCGLGATFHVQTVIRV